MITVAVILAGLSLAASGLTLVFVLVLLGREDFQYTSREDLEQVDARLCANQSQLWRYLEALDDQTGGTGHRVLCPSMPGNPDQAQ